MLRYWKRPFQRKRILSFGLFGLRSAVQMRFVKRSQGRNPDGSSGGYDGGYNGYHSKPVSPIRPRRRPHHAVWEDAFSRGTQARHIPLIGSISYDQTVELAQVAAASPDAMPTPIEVDLNTFIRRSGIDTDYDVNVISVEEQSV